MNEELLGELGQGGAGPGDPPLPHQEAALALAGQQRLAIVELKHELNPLAQRPDRIEHREPRSRGPGRDRAPGKDPLGDEPGAVGDKVLGHPERGRGAQIDRAAKGDDAGVPFIAAIGRGLVTEHPALRVAAEVDLATGCLANAVDRVTDGDDVVAKAALEPTLLALRRAEVDDPGVGAVLTEYADRAGGR